ILKEYQTHYPYQVRIHQNALNIGYNRNFEQVLTLCKGDLIAIADQDDVWMPDKLRKLAELLLEPETVMAYCVSNNFSSHILALHGDNRNWTRMFNGDDTREFIFRNHISGHCMLFKSELIQYVLPVP